MAEWNAVDLSNMSMKELRQLRDRISERIDAIADNERKKLAAEFQVKASELGMTPEEVIRGPKKERRRASAKPKYRDPNDPSRTWAGRGRQPVWLRAALESGKSLSDFVIEAREQS